MLITVDTSQPLSAGDRDILRLLLSGWRPENESPSHEEGSPSASEDSAGVGVPPESSEAPEVDEELLDDAVRKATALLKDKKESLVKAALTDVGVERVTHLDTNAKIRKFIERIS